MATAGGQCLIAQASLRLLPPPCATGWLPSVGWSGTTRPSNLLPRSLNGKESDMGKKIGNKLVTATVKRSSAAPNPPSGSRWDFRGKNESYKGATQDRNASFINRRRAARVDGY